MTKTKFGIVMTLERAVEIMDCSSFIASMFYSVDERRLAFEMILDNAKNTVNFTKKKDFDNVLEFRR